MIKSNYIKVNVPKDKYHGKLCKITNVDVSGLWSSKTMIQVVCIEDNIPLLLFPHEVIYIEKKKLKLKLP